MILLSYAMSHFVYTHVIVMYNFGGKIKLSEPVSDKPGKKIIFQNVYYDSCMFTERFSLLCDICAVYVFKSQ